MFYRAYAFDGDVSEWNMSSVTTMATSKLFWTIFVFVVDCFLFVRNFICFTNDLLLLSCVSMNPIVSHPTVNIVFQQASVFNKDVSKWNTGRVVNMLQSKFLDFTGGRSFCLLYSAVVDLNWT